MQLHRATRPRLWRVGSPYSHVHSGVVDDDRAPGEPFVLVDSGRRWVVYPPVDRDGDGYVYWIDVEVFDEGLSAASSATIEGSEPYDAANVASAGDSPGSVTRMIGVDEFMASLAAGWRGWSGVRRWQSMESGMDLDARHDGRGRVSLGITLLGSRGWGDVDKAWSARIVLTLEAGAQLSRVAGDLSAFLRG